MCNNINYNRNVILVPFVFKTHTYLGQIFWAPRWIATFHPTQDLGTELVWQARGLLKKGKRATKLRPSARAVYRSLGLVGRQGCVEGMQKSTVFFFWSCWSHAVILGVGEQISTWEVFDQGRHSLMRLRRYRWWCAEKHRDPRPRWWWALCAQWKKSGLDLEKDRFLIPYF